MPLWLDYLCAATGLISFALSLKASIIITNPHGKVNHFFDIFLHFFHYHYTSVAFYQHIDFFCHTHTTFAILYP